MPDPYTIVCAAALLVACLAASMVKALREFSVPDLEVLGDAFDQKSRTEEILSHPPERSLAIEAVQYLAVLIYVASGSMKLAQFPLETWSDRVLVSGGWFGLAFALWLAVSWIPWIWTDVGCEGYLFSAWPWWVRISSAAAPLVGIARRLDLGVRFVVGKRPETTREEDFSAEIRTVVTESVRDGLVSSQAREMIEGVIDLAEVEVVEIMTPRPDMVCMSKSVTFAEALDFAAGTIHTRIPVYDRTRDNIVGILHTRDLLEATAQVHLRSTAPPELETILRKPQFVPDTKRVNLLLHEFRKNRNHLAIVLDEFGGVCGLVTIEDVLEEIVGEIADEHDSEFIEGVRKIDDRTAEVFARTHVDDVQERLGILMPADREFDTIGGLVFNEMGRVPKVGESVVWRNIRFTVLDMHGRRIQRIRIENLASEPTETMSDSGS